MQIREGVSPRQTRFICDICFCICGEQIPPSHPKNRKLPLKFCVVYYVNITTGRSYFREVVHVSHTSENVGSEPTVKLIKLNSHSHKNNKQIIILLQVRLPYFSVRIISLNPFCVRTNLGKYRYHRLTQKDGGMGITLIPQVYHAFRVPMERIVVMNVFEVLYIPNPSQCFKWVLLWDLPR